MTADAGLSGRLPSASRRSLILANHGKQLVLQIQPLLFEVFQILIGGVFSARFNAMNGMVHFMIFVKQLGEVSAVGFQKMN